LKGFRLRSAREIIEEAFSHHREGRLDDAAFIYERLLGYMDEPDPNVLYAYGTLLLAQGKMGLGLHLLKEAAAGFPNHAPTWSNMGCAFKHFGRDEMALAAFAEATRLEPEGPENLSNLAGFWINKGEPQKVIEYAKRAVKLKPGSPQAHNHLALGLMEAGVFSKPTWQHYEHRWSLPERVKDQRPFICPKWTGKRVGTLAIHGEQGLGDEILFMGCFAEVAKRVDRILIECAPRLVQMFREAFGVPCYGTHAELIAAQGEPDAYIAMGSLPGLVGLPSGKPYLPRPELERRDKSLVGITWRGGTAKTNKRERSLKLEQLRPILDVPGVDFISVQYGGPEVTVEARAAGINTMNCADFEDLCSRAGYCDLVISVCQTAVHAAGAMGVPTWVLTPKKCAWRYAGKGERMRWYDSVRLFRQGDDERWEPVIERIAVELAERYAVTEPMALRA
jgi:tetratricopeptide (TPR) repeat protein